MNSTDPGQWVRDAVERYEGPLVSHACRILHDLDRARDVVQDTFIRLCRQDREQVADHLAEWLFTVCRNRALEILRKEKRMERLNDDDLAETSSGQPSPAAVLVRAEDQSRVLQIVNGLSDRQQELIRLKFQNGLSYKEISRIMQLSVSNVGVILHHAMQAIRAEMQKDAAGSVPLA